MAALTQQHFTIQVGPYTRLMGGTVNDTHFYAECLRPLQTQDTRLVYHPGELDSFFLVSDTSIKSIPQFVKEAEMLFAPLMEVAARHYLADQGNNDARPSEVKAVLDKLVVYKDRHGRTIEPAEQVDEIKDLEVPDFSLEGILRKKLAEDERIHSVVDPQKDAFLNKVIAHWRKYGYGLTIVREPMTDDAYFIKLGEENCTKDVMNVIGLRTRAQFSNLKNYNLVDVEGHVYMQHAHKDILTSPVGFAKLIFSNMVYDFNLFLTTDEGINSLLWCSGTNNKHTMVVTDHEKRVIQERLQSNRQGN